MNVRRNAESNPKAIYRDPMTLDDYLSCVYHHAVAPVRLRRASATEPIDDRGSRVDTVPDLQEKTPDRRGKAVQLPLRPSVVGPVGRPDHEMALRGAAR